MSLNMASSLSEVSKTILPLNVPEWSQEDVCRWIVSVDFGKYAKRFLDKRVDGDLLLQMTMDQLEYEIEINSEIERKRFVRELDKLKQSADYSCVDSTGLKSVLQSIGPELTMYTYPMLKAGVDSDSIRSISESQLAGECGITNSIHRTRILSSMICIRISVSPDLTDSQTQSTSSDVKKVLDVFISYERCTRSAKLASLLRAHLEFKKYSVIIGSDHPASAEYNDDMLLSIKQAKNFLLVLTDKSLDGCIGDDECKNWMHKEIVYAIKHDCNIIPVMENFTWPSTETLPKDIRDVPGFNAVRWVHDYKYACVDKIEKFMLGSVRCTVPELRSAPNSPLMPRSPSVVSFRNNSNVGEKDTSISNNRLMVNPVDGSSTNPTTKTKLVRRLSLSLGDLPDKKSGQNLEKPEPSQTDETVEAKNISEVSEDTIIEHKDIVTSEKIFFRKSKILFLNKCIDKFKLLLPKKDF